MVTSAERRSGGRALDRVRHFFRRRRGGSSSSGGGGGEDPRIPYNRYLGFHADADNGFDSPQLVTQTIALCDNLPPENMQGAMALWRHLQPSNYGDMLAQRAQAAAYGCESPTILMVPFTSASPGSDDPTTRAAQEAAALAALPGQLALYAAENPIFGIGNLNADSYMPGSSASARKTAWWAFEALAIAIVEAEGYRWCANDDLGIVTLCTDILDRTAAWAVEGVDWNDCEFYCTHNYVVSGYVPALHLLAQDALVRAGRSRPIRVTEGAFGFLGEGATHEDKPWLLNEYARGNTAGPGGTEYPPQSLTWTRLLLQWFRTQEQPFLLFDWTMFVRFGALSSWGGIFTTDQRTQPAFVEPPLGYLWFNASEAPTRAYAIRLSHGGTVPQATAAAQRVTDGYLFTR